MPKPKPFGVGKVRVRVVRGPRDDDRWYWRADRPVGQRQRESVWMGWGTRDEVEEAVIAHLARHRPEAVLADGQIVTVLDLLECWGAAQVERGDIRPMTKRSLLQSVKRLARAEFHRVHLDRLDRGTLERHRDAQIRSGLAGSTVQRDLSVLRMAWQWSREIGQGPPRDLPSVRVRRKDPVTTRYTPTRVEIAQIMQRVRPEWIQRYVQLLATTGARTGEIASLTWERVAPDCSQIWLDGKTNPREIPLHPTMAAAMATWERGEPGERVFPTQTQRGMTASVGRELARVSREIGIPRVSANGLRRAMTDALYGSGHGADVEAALMGHSPKTALRNYRRVVSADLQRALIQAQVGLECTEGQVLSLGERRTDREPNS